jgi:transmembrane 9 superfamily protein 2/4
LCQQKIPAKDVDFIISAINDQYLVKWNVDGLPAAQKTSNQGQPIPGFLLGQVVEKEGKNIVLLNNHFEIYVYFNMVHKEKYRVVGVEVNPSSTKFDNCAKNQNDEGMILSGNQDYTVSYTYDLFWIPSSVTWDSRWDYYLKSADDRVHWFSLINSAIVMFLLSAIVFGVFIRTLNHDINRYNEMELEDQPEEYGWKLVHGDVFRPPNHRMFLSVFVGNGVQLILMGLITLSI